MLHTTCSTAGCHAATAPAAQLDLESPGIIARITGAPARSAPCPTQTLLVPGDTAKSLIYTKVTTQPACGLRMPLTGPLPESDIDCLRRWVLAPSCDDESMPGGNAGGNGAGGNGAGGNGAGGNGAGGNGAGGNGVGGVLVGTGGSSGSGGAGMGSGGAVGSGGKLGGAGGVAGAAGTSGAGGQPTGGAVLYIEGESAMLTDPMVSAADANASGGMYISAPSGDKVDDPTISDMGVATFTLRVATAGDYAAFARVTAMSSSSDSFWVKMDDADWVQWNNVMNSTTWVWDQIHDTDQSDEPVHYQLDAGRHTYLIAYREAGARIDKLAFATDPAFMPMGLGQ
jgi:hypothetical protein